MAGDWIKMRIDLQSHPKIVRILSATDSDKFRVIGGLHAVWSIFDTHSEDGVLKGYSTRALDHVIGWEGFSKQLVDVGWLEELTESLVMPGFVDHNGKSAKRRAEDQKRKREDRNNLKNVRNQSANECDRNGTREEKRREEKKPNTKAEQKNWVQTLTQLGVDHDHAKDWLEVRKGKNAKMTETALKGVQREAAKAGLSLAQAIKMAAENAWQGFKAEWITKQGVVNGRTQENRPLSAVERVKAGAAERERNRQGAQPEYLDGGDFIEGEYTSGPQTDGPPLDSYGGDLWTQVD